MNKRFCKFCDKEVVFDAFECPHCKKVLAEQEPMPQENNNDVVSSILYKVYGSAYAQSFKEYKVGDNIKHREDVIQSAKKEFDSICEKREYLYAIDVLNEIIQTYQSDEDEGDDRNIEAIINTAINDLKENLK